MRDGVVMAQQVTGWVQRVLPGAVQLVPPTHPPVGIQPLRYNQGFPTCIASESGRPGEECEEEEGVEAHVEILGFQGLQVWVFLNYLNWILMDLESFMQMENCSGVQRIYPSARPAAFATLPAAGHPSSRCAAQGRWYLCSLTCAQGCGGKRRERGGHAPHTRTQPLCDNVSLLTCSLRTCVCVRSLNSARARGTKGSEAAQKEPCLAWMESLASA